MADQDQGKPGSGENHLQERLEEANAARAALHRNLKAVNAERAELRERVERLERERADLERRLGGPEPGEAAAGGPAPDRPAPGPGASARPEPELEELIAQAKMERQALAGLISDAVDVHRSLQAGVAGEAARPIPRRPRRGLRARLAATPLARPLRALRGRSRGRNVGNSASAELEDDPAEAGPAEPDSARRSTAGIDGEPGGNAVIQLAQPPVVVEVRGVCKGFGIPSHRIETLKQRLRHHPLTGVERRRLEVLRDVSFEVRQGEFLGVVGTNGVGKSTLLKTIAGSYQVDSGTIRVAGRVAPLIELGVGFHPELSAHDNAVMSATMLGLRPEDARARYPAMLEFAGLEDYAELKLRNYSSGMRVRLAFAVMLEVDADVLLIDEVLAVGDAPFQERCQRALKELHEAGKTILLVSHSMGKVTSSCDRAILLDGGGVAASGPPDEVAARYDELIRERGERSRPDGMPVAGAGRGSEGAR